MAPLRDIDGKERCVEVGEERRSRGLVWVSHVVGDSSFPINSLGGVVSAPPTDIQCQGKHCGATVHEMWQVLHAAQGLRILMIIRQ